MLDTDDPALWYALNRLIADYWAARRAKLLEAYLAGGRRATPARAPATARRCGPELAVDPLQARMDG
jgi:hypothetical protein